MEGRRINFWMWFHRVFAWDGLLPLGIVLLPNVIEFVMPNNGDALAVAAVIVPVVALIIRYQVGRRHIEANNVGFNLQSCQLVVFALAIVLLCIIDSFVIIVHVARGGVPDSDWFILAILASVYLAAMFFAMFPGWTDASKVRTGD